MISTPLAASALVVWALAVAAVDLRQRRVPNALLLTALLPALAALAFDGGGLLSTGWAAGLSGAGAALLLLLPGYALGALGAGDVKLAATQGLLLGSHALGACLLVAALLLGVQSGLQWMSRRGTRPPSAPRAMLPAAPALAAGFVAALALGL